MKALKKILFALFVFAALLGAGGFLLPRDYKVERSVSIAAPTELVFEQVNDLRKTEAWSPWKAEDSTMSITYGPVTVGAGASSSWESKKMGNGTQTIEESVPGRSVKTFIDFRERGNARGLWTFSEEGGSVKVTQAMLGDMGANPYKRYMGFMVDKMVGPYFEKGLASLKQVSEAQAASYEAEKKALAEAALPAASDSLSAPGADSARAVPVSATSIPATP